MPVRKAIMHRVDKSTLSGNIFLTHGERGSFPTLRHIEGYLIVSSDAEFEAPLLESVESMMLIDSGAQICAPRLSRVESLVLTTDGKLDAPSLARVQDVLTLQAGSELRAPLLELGDLHLELGPGSVLHSRGGIIGKPGDDIEQFKRRYVARRASAPHARCPRAKRCVEHEKDSRVEPCAAGGR